MYSLKLPFRNSQVDSSKWETENHIKKKRKLMYHSITQHPVSSNHKLGDWFAKHGTQDLLELNQNMDIASVIQIFISLRQQQQKLYDQVMFSVCFPCWTIAMEQRCLNSPDQIIKGCTESSQFVRLFSAQSKNDSALSISKNILFYIICRF